MSSRREPHAHLPERPSRVRDAFDLVLFLVIAGAIVIALCAVAPEAYR